MASIFAILTSWPSLHDFHDGNHWYILHLFYGRLTAIFFLYQHCFTITIVFVISLITKIAKVMKMAKFFAMNILVYNATFEYYGISKNIPLFSLAKVKGKRWKIQMFYHFEVFAGPIESRRAKLLNILAGGVLKKYKKYKNFKTLKIKKKTSELSYRPDW